MHLEQTAPATVNRADHRIIREAECAHLTGLSRCHRWQLERTGEFPKRLRLGKVAHGWLLPEVRAWLEEKAAEREVA